MARSEQRVLTMGYDDPRFGGLLAQPLASGGFAGIDWEAMFPALAPLIAERRAEYERNANLVANNESMAHLAPMYSVPEGWDQSGLAAEAINRGLITLPELVRQFNQRVGGNRLQLLPNGQVAFTQDIETADPWGSLVSGGLMAGVGALSGGFGLQDLLNAAGEAVGGASAVGPDLGAENFFNFDAANPWSGGVPANAGSGIDWSSIDNAINDLGSNAWEAENLATAESFANPGLPDFRAPVEERTPVPNPQTPSVPTPPTPGGRDVLDALRTGSSVVGAATGLGALASGASQDTSDPYDQVRADEEARQARIRNSVGAIRSQFSRFDDNYLNGVSQAYLDYYLPQFEEQARNARRSLLLSTPSAGTSSYARRSGDLETDIGRQETNIRSQADERRNALRSRLASDEQTLISQAEAAGGLTDAGERAAQLADIATQPESYSPLAQLFTAYTGNVANAAQAERLGYRPTGIVPNIFSRPGGRSPIVYQ